MQKKSILRPNRRKFSSLFEHLAINVAIRTLLYLQFFLHRKSITIPLVCVNPTYVLRIGEFKAYIMLDRVVKQVLECGNDYIFVIISFSLGK